MEIARRRARAVFVFYARQSTATFREAAMTDTTETLANAPDNDVRAQKKDLIFTALAEAGIHRVFIEFDGANDSGQIEGILVWNAAGQTIRCPPTAT
jgi:hypothetical protein